MSYGPPTQPPAGWYPDPHLPGSERYWNGLTWAEQWRPAGADRSLAGPTDRLPDIGGWLARSFHHMFDRWREATIIGFLTSAIPSIMFASSLTYLFDEVVITTDGDVLGWSNDRLPLAFVIAAVAVAVSAVGYLAMQALMLRSVDESPESGRPPPVERGFLERAVGALGDAVTCLPRAIGWFLLLVAAVVGAVLAIVVLAIVTDGVFLFSLFVLVPIALWLAIRLAFVLVAVVDRPGNPFARSWSVSRGRWWAVFGRLLLLGLITAILSTAINAATSGAAEGFNTGDVVVELDSSGNLTDDLVVSEFVDTGPRFLVLTVLGSLLLNLAGAVNSAATAELYRTRNRLVDEPSGP